MKSSRINTLLAASLLTAAAILVGCSTNAPSDPAASTTFSSGVAGKAAGSDIEFYGRIATVDPAGRMLTLVSESTPIEVAEDAEVVFRQNGNETPIGLEDINPGDSAEVRGSMNGPMLLADRVRIRGVDDNGGGGEVEFGGRVATIDPAARTITLVGSPTLINVLPTAEIVQKNSGVEIPITIDDISLGDSLDIRGNSQADGSVGADRVRLRISNEDFSADIEFKSVITAIDYAAGTFLVAGRNETIMTDAMTFIFTKGDESEHTRGSGRTSMHSGGDDSVDDGGAGFSIELTFEQLAVGDSVEVYANMVDAATLYAVAIEVEDGLAHDNAQVEFKDVLASVDVGNGAVTFQNRTESGIVAEGADLAGLNNEPLGLADFVPGELVEIRGFSQSDGTLLIVRMHKDNN